MGQSHFRHTRRIEFHETDMAGIVHFTNYFKYMEMAEHAFLHALDIPAFALLGSEPEAKLGWPRVHAECDYRQPLRFNQALHTDLYVGRIGEGSMDYYFIFRNNEEVVMATGRVVVACVQMEGENRPTVLPIADQLGDKISVAAREDYMPVFDQVKRRKA